MFPVTAIVDADAVRPLCLGTGLCAPTSWHPQTRGADAPAQCHLLSSSSCGHPAPPPLLETTAHTRQRRRRTGPAQDGVSAGGQGGGTPFPRAPAPACAGRRGLQLAAEMPG